MVHFVAEYKIDVLNEELFSSSESDSFSMKAEPNIDASASLIRRLSILTCSFISSTDILTMTLDLLIVLMNI